MGIFTTSHSDLSQLLQDRYLAYLAIHHGLPLLFPKALLPLGYHQFSKLERVWRISRLLWRM